jgi:hypothetical protein
MQHSVCSILFVMTKRCTKLRWPDLERTVRNLLHRLAAESESICRLAQDLGRAGILPAALTRADTRPWGCYCAADPQAGSKAKDVISRRPHKTEKA